MLDRLQSADFSAHLNEIFRIQLDGIDPIDLQLESVSEFDLEGAPVTRTPFSLVFLGPVSNSYLQQHIYALQHEQMGQLEIFLVPLGPERGRMRYEAIFS